MKRNLIALAVSAAIVMPGVAVAGMSMDAPTVYGLMDLSVDLESIDLDDAALAEDAASNWAVNSHSSRFGVKGHSELADGVKAFYKIEWQVSADGDGDTFKQRSRYAGIKTDFGSLQLGKFDTPMKKSQGKFDLFNDHAADIKTVTFGENKESDLIQYTTPKIAGMFTAKLALQPGEENEVTGGCTADADDATKCKDGLTDGFSLSVAGSQGPIYGAIAYDSDIDGFDTIRLVGVFKQDMLQAGILYETSEVADSQMPDASISDPTATSIVVNGAFTMDKIVLKVQYGMQTLDLDVDGADDIDTTLIAVGAEHNCTKQTKLYAEYTTLSVDAGGSSEPSSSVFSVGMLHKF